MLYAISVLKVIPFKNRQHFNAGRAAELFPFPKKIKENNDSRPPGKIVGRAAVFLFMRNMTAHDSLHLARKSLRKESKVVQTKKQYGDFSLTALSFASISIFSG